MDGDASGTAGRVHQVSRSFGFSIFTHMSMTQRGVKYWPFSPLDDFVDEVFKGVIDDIEVGVEQFPFL